MRCADTFTDNLLLMKRLDDFAHSNHPLRAIREKVNKALIAMSGLFADMYEADIKGARSSVAPEKLLRAMSLQVLYSVRSERMLMEQIQYNMLFRWFVGQAMDDAVWVPTVFTKNRQRLIEHDAVAASEGYACSQEKRKRIEQGFGWAKTVGQIRQVLVRAQEKVDQLFVLTVTAYNFTRLHTLGQVGLQGTR